MSSDQDGSYHGILVLIVGSGTLPFAQWPRTRLTRGGAVNHRIRGLAKENGSEDLLDGSLSVSGQSE